MLFSGSAALVSLSDHALPIWLGWSALAIALISLIGLALPEIGFAGFAAFDAWALATSIYLTARPSLEPAAAG